MGGAFLQQLIRLSQYCGNDNAVDLAATLMAASEHRDTGVEERKALRAATHDFLQHLPLCYLHFWAARQKISDPRNDNFDNTFLCTKRLCSQENKPNARMNAQYGRVCVSYAERIMRCGRLKKAEHILRSWRPIEERRVSTMERSVLKSIDLSLGRVLRFKGKFSDSLQYLKSANKANLSQHNKKKILCCVADILLETNRPEQCRNLLTTHREFFSTNASRLDFDLRLADTFILEARLSKAEELYVRVKRSYEEAKHNEMTYVRACTGIAKAHHMQSQWDDAFLRWEEAERAIVRYGWGKGSVSDMITLSKLDILAWKGQNWESQEVIRRHEEDFSGKSMGFWIPGMARWLGWLNQSKLACVAQWIPSARPFLLNGVSQDVSF